MSYVSYFTRFCLLLGCLLLTPSALYSKGAEQLTQSVQLNTAEGTAVAGVDYYIFKVSQKTGDSFLKASGRTDSTGQFSFERTPDPKSKFDLHTLVTHSDEFGYNFYNHSVWENGIKEFTLKKNTDTLKLRFVDTRREPVAGVTFSLQGLTLLAADSVSFHQRNFAMPLIPQSELTKTTNQNGEVSFLGLPNSSAVYLNHDDLRYAKLEGRNHYKYQLQTSYDTVEVTMLPSAKIQGKVLNIDGSPVPQIEVKCLTNYRPFYDGCGNSALTDAQGNFTLQQLRPNHYTVMTTLSEAASRETAAPLLNVKIAKENTTHTVDIQLQRGATLQGFFKDSVNQTPITGETLMLTPEDSNSPLGPFSVPICDDGSFKVKVPEGRYHLYYAELLEGYDRSSIPEFKFEAVNGTTIKHDVLISPILENHYVTGVVLDESGSPVRGATVFAAMRRSFHGIPHSKTDEDGKFKVYLDKANDNQQLFLGAMVGTDLTPLVEVNRGENCELQFAPQKTASIKGRVINQSGTPLSGVKLECNTGLYTVKYYDPILAPAITNEKGEYEFPSVWPCSRIFISASKGGYQKGQARTNELKSNENRVISDITLNPTGQLTISGKVQHIDGSALATLISTSGKGQPQETIYTRVDGSFEIKNASKGKIYIRVQDLKYKSYRTIADGWFDTSTSPIVIKSKLSPPNSSITGQILDANGKPVMGLFVQNYEHGQPKKRAQTDALGNYAIEGLYTGWMDLRISRSFDGEPILKVRTKTGLKNEVFKLEVDDMKKDHNEDNKELPKGFSWVGKPAPEVTVERWHHSKDYKPLNSGKVRIIDFWNIGCGPCVANFPKMEKFWQANKHRKLEMICLHPTIREDEFDEFLTRIQNRNGKLTLPFATEDSDNSVRKAFQPSAAPTYCVIDSKGIVQYFDSGNWEAAKLKALELLEDIE